MKNIGILLSGRGSNFEAIARNVTAGEIPNARIAIVISNKTDAGGLETARKLGLTALAIPSKGKDREEHDREVVAAFKQHKVDLGLPGRIHAVALALVRAAVSADKS